MITEDDFVEEFTIDKKLLYEDVKSFGVVLQGAEYYDGQLIQTSVVSFEGIYVNWSDFDIFELLDDSQYNWSINVNGEYVWLLYL